MWLRRCGWRTRRWCLLRRLWRLWRRNASGTDCGSTRGSARHSGRSLALAGLAGRRLILRSGQYLGRGLGDFGLELVEFLLDYLFVVREVGFQPLESAGIVLGLEVFLEFVQLLVGHLIGQADTHAHLECLVDVL